MKPSVRLTGALGVIHLLALVCGWVSLSDWPRYLVETGVLLSLFGTLSESVMRRRTAAVSLELHADGRCSWRDRQGEWHDARLEDGHFVSVPLIILGLRQGALGRKWIVLAHDSAGADELRRLRALLRLNVRADSGTHEHPAPPGNPDAS